MSRVLRIDTSKDTPDRTQSRTIVDTPRVGSARASAPQSAPGFVFPLSPNEDDSFVLPTVLPRFPQTPDVADKTKLPRFLFAPRKPSPKSKTAMSD